MYFYGLSILEMDRKITNIYNHFQKKFQDEYFVIKTPNTLTFVSERRTVQVILGIWSSVEDILTNADIDCR